MAGEGRLGADLGDAAIGKGQDEPEVADLELVLVQRHGDLSDVAQGELGARLRGKVETEGFPVVTAGGQLADGDPVQRDRLVAVAGVDAKGLALEADGLGVAEIGGGQRHLRGGGSGQVRLAQHLVGVAEHAGEGERRGGVLGRPRLVAA